MVSPSQRSNNIRQGTVPIDDQASQGERHVVIQETEGLDAWLISLGAFLVYTATW
jgi:hypothetical protein